MEQLVLNVHFCFQAQSWNKCGFYQLYINIYILVLITAMIMHHKLAVDFLLVLLYF